MTVLQRMYIKFMLVKKYAPQTFALTVSKVLKTNNLRQFIYI